MTADTLLKEGKLLPLMEEFYTIQGEGFHTGKAAYFIRLGGCDVGCHFCDTKASWNPKLYPPTLADNIIERIIATPAKAVVVTGGEPLNYNLDYFCAELKNHGVETFLETSGSQPLSGTWDWICLSPKKNTPPLAGIFPLAHELKVIIESEKDIAWAIENAKKMRPSCILYLQPEWSRQELVRPIIIDFVKNNPHWKISIQAHKYMQIP